jgi:hypothetical protein
MPGRASKSKLAFQRMVAPEPIAASELDSCERILARLVALAYAGDHPALFTAEPDHQSGLPTSHLLCGNISGTNEFQ